MMPSEPRSHTTSHDLVQQGGVDLRAHRLEDAKRAFEGALEIDRDCVEAYLALSRLRFPGATYLDLLGRLHLALKPRIYVEIGVGNGASISRAMPTTTCIGIDPNPTVRIDLPANVEIIRLTSDVFFEKHDVRNKLSGCGIDLGFVDGLHIFENALKDFENLERNASPDGTILIHDCIPFDELTSERHRRTRFWTGDVWRLLPVLAKFRPDLSLAVVECAPSGLAIVRGLDPGSQTIGKERDAIVAYGMALDLRAVRLLPTLGVHVLPSDWAMIARFLGDSAG